MNLLKLQVAIVILLATVGCATHAKIDMPVISKVNSTKWQGKNVSLRGFLFTAKTRGLQFRRAGGAETII